MAVVHGDVVAAAGPELRALVRHPVAVAIAERRDSAANESAARGRGIQVAVGRHGQMTHRPHVVGDHRRAEALGQSEAAVVGRAASGGTAAARARAPRAARGPWRPDGEMRADSGMIGHRDLGETEEPAAPRTALAR